MSEILLTPEEEECLRRMLDEGPGLESDIPMAHTFVDRGLVRAIDLGHTIDVSVTPLGHLALKQADARRV
jgi:hypothetical protein